MAIGNLFSRRRRLEMGEMPDVYQYDLLPHRFRVQVLHIVSDAVGMDNYGENYTEVIFRWTTEAILREYGLLTLSRHSRNFRADLEAFFLSATTEQALDIIEELFWGIRRFVSSSDYRNSTKEHRLKPEEAIADLNTRFKESGIGYQFEGDMLIRFDSEFLHEEAIRPALKVLRDAKFSGANEEFVRAHEHYRHHRIEECMVDCCKAFESTMKTICTAHGWTFHSKDAAKALIKVCLDNGLVPSYMEQQMTSLRTLFESGIPTVRNKEAGHGQGVQQRDVPEFFARYVLNLTATTILFLVECEAELPTEP